MYLTPLIKIYKELDSTNLELERLLKKDEQLTEGFIVIAEKQTNGKGQNTNKWESELGGLYFSLLLRPNKFQLISLISALSIVKSLEQLNLDNLKIKWPNDILCNEKKISGILVESKFKSNKPEYMILGCGVNINQDTIENVFENIPTSIKKETGKEYNVLDFLNIFIETFDLIYSTYQLNNNLSLLEEFRKYLYKKDEFVKIKLSETEFIEGYIKDINNDGSLVITTKDGTVKAIYSGRILKL